jgi:phenylacetate-CoA ligase
MHPIIEGAYARLPVWAQNAALSAWGWGYRKHRLGGCFEQEARDFRERERWPAERMREHVVAQLRATLLHAFRQTEYYPEKWQALGIDEADLARFEPEDLRRLPLLPRDDLRRDARRMVARDVEAREKLHRLSTSGSTGTPVSIYWTDSTRQRMVAAREARSINWAGGTLLGSRAMIGGRAIIPNAKPKPPYYRYNSIEDQVYFTAFHIRPATAASYVEGFRRYKPRLFTGYAHSYFFLARMMLEQGLTIGYTPEAIALSSEKLTTEMKDVIEQAFGRRPFEEYASVENCVLMTDCERGSLHLSVDFGWVEILDEHDQPVPPGEAGRIVCTGFANEAQPLVRYAVGDVGGFAKSPCPCGRDHLPTMLPIEGRIEDIVYGPDGRQVVRLDWIFRDLAQILEGQIIQERVDQFRVNIVTSGEVDAALSETLRSRLRQRVGEARVSVERVTEIPRSSRGKFRAVVSLLTPEDKQRLRQAGKP